MQKHPHTDCNCNWICVEAADKNNPKGFVVGLNINIINNNKAAIDSCTLSHQGACWGWNKLTVNSLLLQPKRVKQRRNFSRRKCKDFLCSWFVVLLCYTPESKRAVRHQILLPRRRVSTVPQSVLLASVFLGWFDRPLLLKEGTLLQEYYQVFYVIYTVSSLASIWAVPGYRLYNTTRGMQSFGVTNR